MKKRILSGMQVTGKAHIGNYFGAMKQFVELQEIEGEKFIFIANLHSINPAQPGQQLLENTKDLIKDYLAIGLDPERVTLFLQSDVPSHTELSWILSNLVTVPFMERAHAYKDKVANGKEPSVSLFTYPILMAADILLYGPEVGSEVQFLVPVGQDQKQHIEYARDMALKFNNAYGEAFTLPEDYITATTAIVPGIDGRKMSKSYGNHIPLFAEPDEVRALCMKIVTDSKRPEEKKDVESSNILPIYKLVASQEDYEKMLARFESEGEAGIGYKEAKETLAEAIIAYFAPARARRALITDEQIMEVLSAGKARAREVAEGKMKEVRKRIGIFVTE
jgi:tryptophanyl-tRNA synthetase